MSRALMLVVLVVLVALGGAALAQDRAQPAAPADPVAALIAEVRALRAEISETARASIRLQLLVARLQIQEQRIMYLDRQRTDVAAGLAGVQQQRIAAEGAVKMFASVPGQADGVVDGFKAQIEAHQAQEEDLRAREAELLNAIAGEQARWTDLSTRLEDLERSLTR